MRVRPVDAVAVRAMRSAARRSWLALCAALALGAWTGCEEDAQPELAFPAAWRSAGLEVSSFAAMESAQYGAKKCWAGEVDAIETQVCRFDDAKAAKAATDKALVYVGEVTGIAVPSGVWLITVADRKNTDPTGKKINEIAKAFLDHSEVKPSAKPDESKSGDDKSGGDKADGDKSKAGEAKSKK